MVTGHATLGAPAKTNTVSDFDPLNAWACFNDCTHHFMASYERILRHTPVIVKHG
jgi:hypothetical protein